MGDDDVLFEALAEALRDTQDAPPSSAPAIDGYELGEELHRGGQGVVHRAVQHGTRREVAVKLLHSGRHASERERRRFRREAACAARLSHPNVVTLFDSGETGELAWCAMEAVHGVRLDDWMADERAPDDLPTRLDLFDQVCAGVQHAHERGVLHRDIKPANVLVDDRSRARVLDFGLACPVDEALWWGESVTATGEFAGTLAYAAPEQLAGEDRNPDVRSDVYALGVLLYELLTGHRPIDVGGKLSDAVGAVLHTPPTDPRRLRPDLPAPLAAVLLQALAKRPGQRYADVAALRSDLARWRAGRPTAARRPSPPRRALRPTAALLLATALGLGAWRGLAGGAPDPTPGPATGATAPVDARALLADLLGSPGAMESGASRRAVLERAEARLAETGVDDDPWLTATLHQWLAEAAFQLLVPVRAVGHYHRALLDLGLPADDDHAGRLRRARLLGALGETLILLGDRDAHPALVAAERELAALLPSDDPELTLALLRRADALATGGSYHGLQPREPIPALDLDAPRPADVDAAVDQLLARASRRAAEPVAGIERLRGRLAQLRAEVQDQRGDPEAALASLDEARRWYDSDPALGGPHAVLAACHRARLLRSEGRPAAADAVLVAVVDRLRALHGADAGETLEILGRAAVRRQDAPGAALLLRRALAQQLRAEASADAATHARALAVADDLERGGDLLPALQLQVELADPGAYEVSRRASIAADVCQALGLDQQALELSELALQVGCRDYGAACPFRRLALERAVQLAERLGDSERAAAHAATLERLPPTPDGAP